MTHHQNPSTDHRAIVLCYNIPSDVLSSRSKHCIGLVSLVSTLLIIPARTLEPSCDA